MAISLGAASLLVLDSSDPVSAVAAMATSLSVAGIVLLVKPDDAGRIFRVIVFTIVGWMLLGGNPYFWWNDILWATIGGLLGVAGSSIVDSSSPKRTGPHQDELG